MIGNETWNDLEFGYDYSQNDILWSYDRDAGELTIVGELHGEEVEITFAATAEEWSRVAELFEDGDCDAVDEWHMAHIVSVEVA